MRPFRAPREAFQRDKPDRSMEADSEEATELGLVYGPWIIKETQDAIQPHDEQHLRCMSPNVHVTSSELTSPSLSEFESYLEARESSVKNIAVDSMNDEDRTHLAATRQALEELERSSIAAGEATSPPLPTNVSLAQYKTPT